MINCSAFKKESFVPKINGSCLCGNVSYECSAEPSMTAICHCKNCQKQTGTAFSIILAVYRSRQSIQVDFHGLRPCALATSTTKSPNAR